MSEPVSDQCGRLLVGQGDDTYDPNCVLPQGHTGQCSPHPPLCRAFLRVTAPGLDENVPVACLLPIEHEGNHVGSFAWRPEDGERHG